MKVQIKGFNEEQANSFQSFIETLNDSQKAKFEEINAKFKTFEDIQSKVKEYGTELSELSSKLDEVKAMKSNNKENKELGFWDAAKKSLKDDIEKNGKLSDSEKKRVIQLAQKGVAFTGRIPSWDIEQGIEKAPDRAPSLMAVVPSGPTNSDTVGWFERVARTDNGAWVGELEAGGAMDLAWQEFDAKVKTFSQNIKVPRQKIDDVDYLMSEIQTELMDLLKLSLEKTMLSGNATANPKEFDGIIQNAVAFNTTDTIKLDSGVSATNFDVCHAVCAQVARAKFRPTHIFVSINKAFEMGWQRDGNGQYNTPGFVTMSPTGIVIDGAQVVATSLITATEGGTGITDDSIIAIDASKLKMFYNTAPFIEIADYNEDDFIKYAKTVAIFVRCVLRMKVANYPSMVKGTFTAIKAAIETA